MRNATYKTKAVSELENYYNLSNRRCMTLNWNCVKQMYFAPVVNCYFVFNRSASSVIQQAAAVRTHSDLQVGEYMNVEETSVWTDQQWSREIIENQVCSSFTQTLTTFARLSRLYHGWSHTDLDSPHVWVFALLGLWPLGVTIVTHMEKNSNLYNLLRVRSFQNVCQPVKFDLFSTVPTMAATKSVFQKHLIEKRKRE